MDNLAASRRAIRRLLNERQPGDAVAAYYAFHHPEHKTQLLPYLNDDGRAIGYVALSRTGLDLFRPLVTLRLPEADMAAGVDFISQALLPGTAVILLAPRAYLPLLRAVFDIQMEDHLQVMALDRARFEPIINVLVAQTTGPNHLPRFIIRRTASPDQEIVAAAGLNWQSSYFAEISVHTSRSYQRQGWGRSVVAAMVQHVLANGRTPLYIVSENNLPSIQLARSVGFQDSGQRQVMLQAVLNPRP